MRTHSAHHFPISLQKNKVDKKEIYTYSRIDCAVVHDLVLDTPQEIQHLAKASGHNPENKKSSLKIEEDEWLTSEQAAHYLKVSNKTLLNMVSNGRIPYAKLGRSNRYLRNELRKLLLSNKRGLSNGN